MSGITSLTNLPSIPRLINGPWRASYDGPTISGLATLHVIYHRVDVVLEMCGVFLSVTPYLINNRIIAHGYDFLLFYDDFTDHHVAEIFTVHSL